ncbi:hypothetical protein AALB16_08270 [Lachnospiraceae bacterium 62-35]
MNYENTYEQELDLKDLLFYLLYGWRPIILIAVIMGLLFGGYKVVGGLRSQKNGELVSEAREKYEKDRQVYERSLLTYEKEIEKLQMSIEEEEKYLENSVLMNINPYAKPKASAEILVKLDEAEWLRIPESVQIDPTDSLIKAYTTNIIPEIDWEKIVLQTGVEEQYLKELVNVGTDYASNTFSVEVVFLNEDMADEILSEILDQINQRYSQMAEAIGAHSITILNQTSDVVSDLNLVDRQRAMRERVFAYQKNIADKEKALSELSEPAVPGTLSKRALAKTGIKYFIVGGVLGGFLAAAYFGFIYLMSNRLRLEEELKNWYGFRILGVFALPMKTKPFSSIDRWLERLEGKADRPSEEIVIERIAANIQNYTKEEENIVLTGTVPDEKLNEIRDKLSSRVHNIDISVGLNVIESTNTLHQLAECNGVILVEQRGVSKHTAIQREKEIIDDLKKPVVGCIVI